MSPILRRWLLAVGFIVVLLYLAHHYVAFSPSSSPSTFLHFPPKNHKESFTWADVPLRYPDTDPVPLPATAPSAALPSIQHDFVRQHKQKQLSGDKHLNDPIRKVRLAAVKEAFAHSWAGYSKHAWLHDEVKPLTGGVADPFGGWAATLVDSLDALWLMGMEEEFMVALGSLEKVDFSRCGLDEVNVFETTIRYLGGFLGAWDVTGERFPLLLEKAVEVAEMLLRAFDTPTRMPVSRWDWRQGKTGVPQVAPSTALSAELGSFTLEMARLSQITKDGRYFSAAQRIMDVFAAQQNSTRLAGLWPITVDAESLAFNVDTTFTLGGMADSLYEYLPKTHLLLGGRTDLYRDMYLAASAATKQWLAWQPTVPKGSLKGDEEQRGLLVLGTARLDDPPHDLEWKGTRLEELAAKQRVDLDPEGQHLTCFAGGMFALASRAFASSGDPQTLRALEEDLDVGARITDGCVWSYRNTPTGIGPEIWRAQACRKGRAAVSNGAEPDWEGHTAAECAWDDKTYLETVRRHNPSRVDAAGLRSDEDAARWLADMGLAPGFTGVPDRRYMLRPEAIESVFLLYRITGRQKWRDAAWDMFGAIVRATRTDISFAALDNVMLAKEDGKQWELTDSVESFWTAETLKYFYLIFADEDLASLDEFVFNTEAHPLRWRHL